MKIESEGNLSDNNQKPHNCSTGLIHDLVQHLLLFLRILHGILHVVGTVDEAYVVAWDLVVAEHTKHIEHTMDMAEASSFD